MKNSADRFLIIDDLENENISLSTISLPEIVSRREYQTRYGTATEIVLANGVVILQSAFIAAAWGIEVAK